MNSENDISSRAFRVLVVINDDADREAVIRHLGESWPFEHEMVPDKAGEAREALDKMRRARYALVVLDWQLPGMDGGELLRVMRQEGVLTPAIVVSGYPREGISQKLELAGVVLLNQDDMNPRTLRDAVAAALHQLGIDRALAA
ncbi:MAG TPA: response regulator [Verrucomicrobiae bacterium]|nr:response regulator [Verrucomicrobiae bacterium]